MSDDIDLTPEAVAKLDEKLASQIGDDVSVIFNHESLFKQSRMMIAALSARLAALEAAKWDVQHTDTMNDIVQVGMARDQAEARAKDLEAQLAQAGKALRPFARATITPTGEIVGMERVFFEQARATLAQIGEGHD
jgi:uncharacterized protein with PhoU and TrkA domain